MVEDFRVPLEEQTKRILATKLQGDCGFPMMGSQFKDFKLLKRLYGIL